MSNHPAINEALAKSLGAIEDVLDIDLDLDQSLPFIDDIIRHLQVSNRVQRSSPNSPKPVAKLIDDDVDLLDVNEPRIVKAKGRPARAKNRKSTMTRTKKAKAKSTKRDPSGFEHVDAAIKASRDGKGAIERGGDRDKARQRKQKEPEADTVAAIDANIQAFNEDMDEIHEDMRGIITRQTARTTAEEATATSAASATPAIIKATTKKVIQVDDDDEFDADGGGDADADSDDDWMYDRG